MPQTITPEICSKLGEIGFDQNEINTFQMVHELRGKTSIDLVKLIHRTAFKGLSEGVAQTFEEKGWSEEDFFEMVEKHREKKKK